MNEPTLKVPLPYIARTASILLVLLNAIGAFVGLCFFWTGFPIPALVVYGILVGIAFGNRSTYLAKAAGITGLLYNFALAFYCYDTSKLSFMDWLSNDLTFADPWGSLLTSFGYSISLYVLFLYSLFSPTSRFNPPVFD